MQEEKILQNQNNHTEPDVEPTNRDILEAVNGFATHVEGRFTKVEGCLVKVDGQLAHVEGRLAKVEHRLDRIENTMVTKSYLDDKLGDLRGDLVVLMRKEDNKVKKLVEILLSRQILTEQDKQEIFALEPFAQPQ